MNDDDDDPESVSGIEFCWPVDFCVGTQVFEDLDRVGLGGNLDVLAARAECCYEQVSLPAYILFYSSGGLCMYCDEGELFFETFAILNPLLPPWVPGGAGAKEGRPEAGGGFTFRRWE